MMEELGLCAGGRVHNVCNKENYAYTWEKKKNCLKEITSICLDTSYFLT